MKGLVTVGLLAVVAVGVFALGGLRGKDAKDKSILHVAEEVPLKINVASPERREVIRLVQAPGEVKAVLEVDISSEIVSKIEEMPVEEGDLVKRGQLLCRLDDDNLLAQVESGEARVAGIRAAVVQAEAEFERADRDLQRQIRLSESNATTAQELADYRTNYKRATATLEMRKQDLVDAEAVLKRVREDLKRTIIESPIDGVISKLNAKQGEVVITGTMNNPGTVILTISDLSKMEVLAKVDEIDVPLVEADQKARIYLQADQDKPVAARVVRVATKGSKPMGRDVVTFETVLEVQSNDERIKPGMTANVEIEVAQHEDALTVPVEAIVHRLRKELADDMVAEYDKRQSQLDLSERARQAQYIKVIYVKENDTARIRLIETGISDSKRVEMLSGVAMEDTVIVGPYRSLDQLKDGRKVALIEEVKKEGQPKAGEPEKTPEQSAHNDKPAENGKDSG